jgi:(p)ppGpp synthase/HD superfamily hydrolase
METNYDALIQASADELFQRMSLKEEREDVERLRAAFEFAREAHSPQRRKSGEPYIIHPVNVARIVAEELELGADPIIAAFLDTGGSVGAAITQVLILAVSTLLYTPFIIAANSQTGEE